MMLGLANFGVRLLCPGTDTAVAADTAAKGATDAATAGAADAGVAAGAAGAADVAAGAGAVGAGDAAAGLTAADIAAGAGTSAEGATLLSTAAAPAIAGAGTGALVPGLAGAALGAGAGLAGGSSAAAPTSAPADVSPGMLSATTGADITGLDPTTASMLGVDSPPLMSAGTIDAGGTAADAGTVLDPVLSEDPSMLEAMPPDQGGGIMDWLKNPKNALTAGMLGVSGLNALFPPKLPGAAKTALSAAGPAVQQATMTIETGGTGSPAWAGMKSNIDAQVDQYIQQQTESLMQTAANAGETGQNGVPSGVVKEQIASMTAQANVQRQAMYQQALSQLVNEAVSELTGANQTLTSIANMQLQEQEQARASAGQTAELALLLNGLSG